MRQLASPQNPHRIIRDTSTGERSLGVAEKFTHEQGTWNRTAVDGSKPVGRTLVIIVDGATNQLPAGAVLVLDQDGCAVWRDFFDEVEDLDHFHASSD